MKKINTSLAFFYACNRLAKHALLWCKTMLVAVALTLFGNTKAHAQELNARVVINHNQIQGTDISVFENLEKTLQQFVNNKQWTDLKFKKNERINCVFNITINEYDNSTNLFKCRALIQANRPVFGSNYNSVIYNNYDNNFEFNFAQFDQIEFNEENLQNQLTTLLGYYAFLIIGLDLDSFSPNGGQDVLQRCLNLTNNAQNLNYTGWKAFEDDRNRFAIINDYLDPAMAPFRELQYNYYRKGLDQMTTNPERARVNITDALEQNLAKARENKPLSLWPLIWTDYKKDELANIYKGKGTAKEKDAVFNLLFKINASQNNTWEKIKQ